jgi:hypothetical protein
MAKKGRAAKQQGIKHGHARLTEKDVLKIRKLPNTSHKIANQYGVSPALICLIQKRKIWKHLV